MTNKENPYERLKREAREWIEKSMTRQYIEMWTYPAATIHTDKWILYDLAQRVQAAGQLGYDVELVWDGIKGLKVVYIKKLPSTPYWY